MTAEVRRGIVLAVAGLLGGFAMVVALFGTGELLKHNAAVNPSAGNAPSAKGSATPEKPAAGTETGDRADGTPSTGSPHAALGPPSQAETGPAGRPAPDAGAAAKGETAAPTFDIVRVEPDGASVIAGRAAPHARIELLRDGRPFATGQADAAGQFALTPPDLPTGTSEIALRATAADGAAVTGRESVSVVVADRRDTKPLIALSAPDMPTRVLSQPGAPDAPNKAATASVEAPRPETKGKAAGTATGEGPVRIVSVDAQAAGRLDVTGQAAPGSALRLYLNDTMVASGRAGADGRMAFTIGRGVKPGAYRIRVDAVDAKGKVRNRAEVAFAYPEGTPPTRLADAEPTGTPAPGETRPPAQAVAPAGTKSHASPKSRPEAARNAAGAKPPQTKPGETKPTLGLAGAPPRTDEPAPATPERPAVPGTAALAAASGAGAPSPGTDRQAAASLAPALPTQGGNAAPGTTFVPEVNTARITRGDNLWQISRRTYGRGNRYTVIYDANQDQIRDPNRIYPGQMFVLPKDEPAGSAPSARSGTDRRT